MNKIARAHISLLLAGTMWGLMLPIGKSAMTAGISSLSLTTMRMVGAAICFWIGSLFTRKEKITRRDYGLLFLAGLIGIVFNQGLFVFGLSLASPVDASIITTALPIITMILAAIILKEPMSSKKIIGVVTGTIGAIILIVGSQNSTTNSENIWGDLMCIVAQVSFAFYLTVFKGLISRYSVFTLMKWMFTYASICFIPVSFNDLSILATQTIPITAWLQAGYVVLFGTFGAYIFVLIGQKTLRPTVVSMYNYVQPIVGSAVSVMIGIGNFGWDKAAASFLIFTGVYIVTKSKAKQ